MSKLEGRDRDIKLLMSKCESNLAAATRHAKGERDARLENKRLRHQLDRLEEQSRALRVNIPVREQKTEPSGEDEGSPTDDPRRGHPESQSRLVLCA